MGWERFCAKPAELQSLAARMDGLVSGCEIFRSLQSVRLLSGCRRPRFGQLPGKSQVSAAVGAAGSSWRARPTPTTAALAVMAEASGPMCGGPGKVAAPRRTLWPPIQRCLSCRMLAWRPPEAPPARSPGCGPQGLSRKPWRFRCLRQIIDETSAVGAIGLCKFPTVIRDRVGFI